MTHDPEQCRARIYVLRMDEPHEICQTSLEGIGQALILYRDEGEILPDDRVGILDRPVEDEPGTWLVNLWTAD